MEIEKIFNDLESNQTHESEEAKKKLVELFSQNKEQWLVHYMMEYFLKTGSLRIMEVLVKVQSPHDNYIFDRLAEWIKQQTYRVQALNLFSFVVRKHPTWLFKVEKHRLIREIFKLLLTEKEIVPLMSALLCIITLLPLIPNLVPNFLNTLFEVFGHLASWNCQNPNRLPDDKLIHLQLGLQLLFLRLYGMYPCNFLTYLSNFIKKGNGAIFHHTIKPLLETVRVNPLLVTETTESEVNNSRWKEIESHDVVVECARLSLPSTHQDDNINRPLHTISSDLLDTPSSMRMLVSPNISKEPVYDQFRTLHHTGGPTFRIDNTEGIGTSIWSPYNEITASGSIPLTPTPSYMLTLSTPVAAGINNQLMVVTGSSPPEAAVEATPETTPLKDLRDVKDHILASSSRATNSPAVREIFASSQSSSPMPKDENRFNFPDITTDVIASRPSSTYDRRLQKIIYDRSLSQSPFETIESQTAKQDLRTPTDTSFKCETPNIDSEMLSNIPTQELPRTDPIVTTCNDCNETERTMCTAGGLHIATSTSMQLLANGIKKRNRMASYCYNDASCEKINSSKKGKNESDDDSDAAGAIKVRRTKSCSSICFGTIPKTSEWIGVSANYAKPRETNEEEPDAERCRLQKSSKMLSIATASKKSVANTNASCQTVEIIPQYYENSLFEILLESNNIRNDNEKKLRYPQEKFNQDIVQKMHIIANSEGGPRYDQEQYQLLLFQLQYERYRREIHAERNRRLMGRSRDRRTLEMERDRLKEQLKNFAETNKKLEQKIGIITKMAKERDNRNTDELMNLKEKYQEELEQIKCLRQANENLQTRLNEELTKQKDVNYELEALRGEIFSVKNELEHSQAQAEMGLQCKQELARLEAEFIVMGEVQVKCRDRLAELDNYRARDEEQLIFNESYNLELKDLRHSLEEKTSQVDSAKHKVIELQSQLTINDKVITEQKRLLKAVKDEYEEKFKALNKKYEVQKTIIMQMEEKIVMFMHKQQSGLAPNKCSPDTDKTDMASSMDRNSPLSTSLASSESLSASLRSTELRNLQQLVETPTIEASCSSNIKGSLIGGRSIAATSAINISPATSAATATGIAGSKAHVSNMGASNIVHTHYDLQQQK